MSDRLIIRADANTRMGTGHVMRCIALGQAWQDAGGDVLFISCCESETLKQRIRDEAFELVELPKKWLQNTGDMECVLETARQKNVQWIVTDGYHFDLDYQHAICTAGFKLICIDDYNHLLRYEAEILLNQNYDAESLAYACNQECRKLLGLRYAMLRREFRRPTNSTRLPDSRQGNILVTMGGSDPDNATLQVLKALANIDVAGLHVKIVIGPSNPHQESLSEAAGRAGIECDLLHSVRDMPGLMEWAGFAVTAAGSTCWELASMGVPFASVIIAENQERIARGLERDANIPTMGWVDSGFSTRCMDVLSSCLTETRVDELRRRVASLVDRFGVDRILCNPAKDCGLELMKGRLSLRLAKEVDAELLFEWANDPVTRRNSFNSETILWEDHSAWFSRRMENSEIRMFMLELDRVPCGHIRYELDVAGDAVLSFVVSPAFRGMGIGQKLVELSLPEIARHWNGCRIKALTLEENRTSAGIFEKVGFSRQETEPVHGKKCSLFVWRCGKHE